MNTDIAPILKIVDIIKLKRINHKQSTKNKSCFVISCRINGESVFYFNNTAINVKKGDILYIPYGATYSQECSEEEMICFHLDAYSDMPDNINIYTPKDTEYICSLFQICADEWQNRKDRYKCRCTSLLYEILSQINIGGSQQVRKENPSFKTAKEYLESHIFSENFNISDLCRSINMSRTYFNKLFKEYFNISPIKYINKKRIEKAKFLLKCKNYSNEEISKLCGFNDVKYFYVVFKKETGLTTNQFLNEIYI